MKTVSSTNSPSEIYDFISLLICCLAIPIIWLSFGWQTHLLATGHDGLTGFVPYMKGVLASHGDWTKNLYNLEIEGGIQIHDIVGTLPIYQLFGILGLSITTSINLTVFFIQIVYSYLCYCTCINLVQIWNIPTQSGYIHSKPQGITRLSAIIIFGFSPVLGWKLGYGHFNMIFGIFFFLGGISILISAFSNQITFTSTFVAAVTMSHCLPSNGQQVLAYSFVFGLPITIGLLIALSQIPLNKNLLFNWIFPILVAVGAISISIPKFASMISTAISSDSARSMQSESIIYQYLTANWLDWISSIPWSKDLINPDRNFFFHHEINYPFGPLILLLILLPWQKMKHFITGLLVSLILVLCFSMNIDPIAKLLPLIFPFLNVFRVPERAMMLFSLLVPILAIAALLYRFSNKATTDLTKVNIFFALLFCAIFYFSTSLIREIAMWLLLILVMCFHLFSKLIRIKISKKIVLLILAFGSVSAFKERLILPFYPLEQMIANMEYLGNKYLSEHPQQKSNLNRVHVQTQFNEFFSNSPYMMNLSTINGYFPPQRRFSQLTSALMGVPYYSTTNYFSFDSSQLYFKPLRQLYNICCTLEFYDNSLLTTSDIQTAGPAWFTETLVSVPSIVEFASILKGYGDQLAKQLFKTGWIIDSDPTFIQLNLPKTFSPKCKESRVLQVTTSQETQEIRLHLENNESLCPLAVSMNFASNLRAYSNFGSDGQIQLTLFPIYGALTGILIPAGVTDLTLLPTSLSPSWTQILFYIGIAVWLICVWIIIIHKKQQIA